MQWNHVVAVLLGRPRVTFPRRLHFSQAWKRRHCTAMWRRRCRARIVDTPVVGQSITADAVSSRSRRRASVNCPRIVVAAKAGDA